MHLNPVALLIFMLVRNEQSSEIKPKFQADKVIKNMGYPVESHKVTTPDGYILTIHRVPYGKNSTNSDRRLPVLLTHGLTSSTDHFTIAEENSTLFYLVEKGYDVWVGNSRGNKYSREHVKLNPDRDGTFWQFSWHEIGVIDVPMTIDYILNKTNQTKLFYVGHSQGTTTFLVMASERPEYNNKIKLAVLISPSAFMANPKNPFLPILSNFQYKLYDLAVKLNFRELIPFGYEIMEPLSPFLINVCEFNEIFAEICANVFYLLLGYNLSEQLAATVLAKVLQTGVSTFSAMQALHYLQGVSSGKFSQFDYGPGRNLIYYNSTSPPEYNLKNIVSPVALFYGNTDTVTTVKDVRILRHLLPNVVFDYFIPRKEFNHYDFLWSKELVGLVNKPLYNLMKKYENN